MARVASPATLSVSAKGPRETARRRREAEKKLQQHLKEAQQTKGQAAE
jgi:hypothetical protein